MDKAPDSSGLRGGDDGGGACDVAGIEGRAVRRVDRSGDVDDGVGPGAEVTGRGKVAANPLNSESFGLRAAGQRANGVAARNRLPQQVAADEPRPAGDGEDQAAISNGWISPLRYCERALLRDSLPLDVRGRVRGGTSSTTHVMPVIVRTLVRIASRSAARSATHDVRHWTRRRGLPRRRAW